MNLQRVLILGFVLAAVVAGAIGMRMYQQPADIPQKVTMPPPYVMPLEIEKAPEAIRVEEAYTAGHHDFHFVSKAEKPTQVGVNWRACRCASVAIALAPEEWKDLPATELSKRTEDSKLQWVKLEENSDTGFTIPPHAQGWIRLNWNADKSGDERFSVDMWLEQPRSSRGFELNIPVRFIRPVQVAWEKDGYDRSEAEIGVIAKNAQRTIPFVLWSTTRKQFTLAPAPAKKDPCLTFGAPIPLKPEELEKLSRENRKALCGYRVEIHLVERTADALLDLGALDRSVAWKSNVSDRLIVASIRGRVDGEVTLVGSEAGSFSVAMNQIHPTEPAKVHFVLRGEDPRLELTPDEETMPSFLRTELTDGAKGSAEKPETGPVAKVWNATVSFRPDSDFRGRFPDPERQGYEKCFVVFRVRGSGIRERRLWIPVTGEVLVK